MLGSLLLAGALALGASATAPAGAAPHVPAPTPIFRSFGVADGLPSATVYAITQDHTGYIWIGTHAGLARYDGRAFKVFRHVPGQPASLPANDISSLLVDRDGRLWVAGEDTGLNRYDPTTGGFRHWLHEPANAASLGGDDVMALAQDADGAIWVGTYMHGLSRLDPDGRGFTHVRHVRGDPASLASDNVTALAAGTDGGLWIGTDAGLDRMDAGGRLHHVALPGAGAQPNVWQVRVAAGGVDVATGSGLFHIGASGAIARVGPAGQTLASLRSRDGGVWLARGDGLRRVAAGGAVRDDAPAQGLDGSLPGRLPDGLFRDREGGLWVALMDGGLAYLSPQWRGFSVFRHVAGKADTLASDRVRATALAPDGSVWAAGAGMLDRIDTATGRVRHVALPGLDGMSIATLAFDRTGNLWLGGRTGLRVWDGRRLRTATPGGSAEADGVRRFAVTHLLTTRGGSIYCAAVGGGVYRVDPATLTLYAIRPPGTSDAAAETVQLAEAPDGSVWAATRAGIARLAPDGNAFEFVGGIARESVQAFGFGPNGGLWIAFANRLARYSMKSSHAALARTIGTAEGWPDAAIAGLQADRDGRVVVLGTRRLFIYDPRAGALRSFALAEGIATPDFTGNALQAAGPGQFFAATLAGVIAIHTAELARPVIAPKVALESVSVRRDGTRIELDPAHPVALDWRDRELTVSARVLSFVDPALNRYRFRLEGFDPGWVDTGERDVREFSVLDPGDYRLLVGGRSGDGPWSTGETLNLGVRAAPWVTPWAWAGYTGVAALLAAWVAWSARNRLRARDRLALSEERQQLAEQANAAKSRFLANMAHEIRTPLTGVLGMAELLLNTSLDERQQRYASAIQHSGTLLLRQVNDALDVARIEAGRLELNPAPFDPAALLREVADADTGIAAQKSLTLDVTVAPDAPRCVLGDAVRVQQILLNLSHNAIKFTTRGGVTLRLEPAPHGLTYRVSDQGPGLTADECARVFDRFEQTPHGRRQRGSGLGLAISHDLVTLMRGTISAESVPGRGSTFSVYLPLPSVEPVATKSACALPPAAPAPAQDAGGPARVLLVEDDAIAGEAIAGLIESFGYRVVLVPQALAALAEIDSGTAFAAMVFDFDLPGMHGCDLARLLRRRGVTTTIIALTAGTHGDEAQRAQAAGMNAFIRKPAPPTELRAALRAAVATHASAGAPGAGDAGAAAPLHPNAS